MSLSANTLIHFTESKDVLKKILQENFRIFNCKESISFGEKVNIFYVPMVSFCDIPLSEVKDHISKYGNYGLGMTKEWGIRMRLNPVLYMMQTSELSNSYRTAFNYISIADGIQNVNDWSSEKKSLADVLRYMKNYEADLIRQNKTIPNYRFSDEREWRYVPPYTENCDMLMRNSYYEVPKNKDLSDAKLTELRLVFEPNDIKYIIINDDSEIGEFVEHLRRVKGKSYALHDIERLTTRIMTTEQILSDM